VAPQVAFGVLIFGVLASRTAFARSLAAACFSFATSYLTAWSIFASSNMQAGSFRMRSAALAN
jgi:hypothetical protein